MAGEGGEREGGVRLGSEAFDSTMDGVPRAAAPVRRLSSTDAGDGEEPPRDEEDALVRGDLVGRYVVLSRIGKGGMGVVYAAYDPDLDRKVALKLLLSHRGKGEGRVRLLREAQAMARLADPNVVRVYDVGALGERVWIAMEFVHGQTLTRWARPQRRWHELLPVFVRAGEGLAAAHAAGLVHRDFKPDNVMIDDDGRVHVMDFGLAWSDRSLTKDLSHSLSGLRGIDALREVVTREGAVIGTPQYMAPEQWEGGQPDPRTDQFAYCVTLWEALHGAPPFAGTTIEELVSAVLAGRVQRPSKQVAPWWLQRALLRGLQVEPERRFASMRALLDALGRGEARGQLRRAVVGACVAGLAIAGVIVGQQLEHKQRMDHAALREKVRGARDHSSAIVGHVLGLRAGMLADYDPLALEVRRLVAVQAELRGLAEATGGAHRPEVLARLAGQDEALAGTVAQVERFKTQFAVLRNSSQVFPVLVAELTAAAPGLEDRLATLLRELLRFNNMGGDEAAGEIQAAADELAVSPAGEATRGQLELLRRHAVLILEHRPAVDRIVREISQLHAAREDEALADAIIASDVATIGPDAALRWTLLVAGVVGAAGWLLLQVRRRSRA